MQKSLSKIAHFLLCIILVLGSCDYVGIVEDRLPTGIEDKIYSEWQIEGVTLSGAHGVLTEVTGHQDLQLRYLRGKISDEMAASLRIVPYTEEIPELWPDTNYAQATITLHPKFPQMVCISMPEEELLKPLFLTLIYKYGKKNEFAHFALIPPVPSVLPGINDNRVTAVISDIHMNDLRSKVYGYSWFKSNATCLTDYLDYLIAHADRYRELVLLGDVFDEYVTPAPLLTFANILEEPMSESAYIRGIAKANQSVIDKFRELQEAGVQLVYMPGNHDMGTTEEDIQSIFGSSIRQARDVPGLGSYEPLYASSVVMEHSHRYDVLCAPDPFSNIGIDSVTAENAFLPAGYFTTRIGATNALQGLSKTDLSNFNLTLTDLRLTKHGGSDKGNYSLMKAVWNVMAIAKPIENLEDTPIPTGLNGLTRDYTLDEYSLLGSSSPSPILYKTMYKQSEWEERLLRNNAPSNFPFALGVVFCEVPDVHNLVALWLHTNNPTKRIVVFGHTHQSELSIQRVKDGDRGFIYANSGSWVDDNASSYAVRTFVEIYDGIEGYKRVSLNQWTQAGYIQSLATPLWLRE